MDETSQSGDLDIAQEEINEEPIAPSEYTHDIDEDDIIEEDVPYQEGMKILHDKINTGRALQRYQDTDYMDDMDLQMSDRQNK